MRSLFAHLSEFRDTFNKNDFDFLALSETWLNEDTDNTIVALSGYNLFRSDRNGRGGGVAIYARKNTVCSIISVDTKGFDELWLTANISGQKYAIGVIYKPPNYNVHQFASELEDSINITCQNFDNIILSGDFNIDVSKINKTNTILLNNLLESYDLIQLIDQPTGITATSQSIIDIIICSKNLILANHSVSPTPVLADHNLIYCEVKLISKKFPPKFHTFRDFKKIDKNLFDTDLKRISFHDIFNSVELDRKVEIFNTLILELFDKHAPIKTVKITKKRAPWLTDNIKLLMKFRDNALCQFKRSRDPSKWDYYKQLRNFIQTAYENEKRAYLQFQINNDLNKRWMLYRSLNILNNSKDTPVPETLGTTNDLNIFFRDTNQHHPDRDMLLFYKNNKKRNIENFKFQPTSECIIYRLLLTIKSNATGCDKISLNMILLCCPYIIRLLLHIINFSLNSGKFPTPWKVSEIIPIPNVTNPTEFGHLRPISILPVLSKLLEKAMYSQIRDHTRIIHHDVLPSTQSGFRPGHSCITTLLGVTDVEKHVGNEKTTNDLETANEFCKHFTEQTLQSNHSPNRFFPTPDTCFANYVSIFSLNLPLKMLT
nr:unnamed protein product [Callosobruchus analis]